MLSCAHNIRKTRRNVIRNILGFHASTGCDTASALNEKGKKTAWVKYIAQPYTLEGIAVSKFLFVLYGCCQDHPPNIDTSMYRLLLKARKSLDLLPPTNEQHDVSAIDLTKDAFLNAHVK
ncbi:hypothetical protein DPMN_140965 [Dreissena polymorpha]|uniref:Uncharacterized protein n=1 Tax=Dreissena polymorpha TaxID=45954 RepID=A0A9D4G8K5_DREPO|nr:hypothetical protein DPMN_140965 [Dreissena polymorpha]